MTSLTGQEQSILASLLLTMRWVSLATCNENRPNGSQVAVVPHSQPGSYLMHLSGLALHTRNLRSNPHASIVMAHPWVSPGEDPQTLPRVSIAGTTDTIYRSAQDFDENRNRFLAAFPAAEIQFELDDFQLIRFDGKTLRFIAGVGRIHQIECTDLDRLGVRWI